MMFPTWLAPYVAILGLTIGTEAFVAWFIAPRRSRAKVLRDLVLLNLFTHPLANLGYQELGIAFAWVEICVLSAETAGYRMVTRLGWRDAALVATGCNAVTAALSFAF